MIILKCAGMAIVQLVLSVTLPSFVFARPDAEQTKNPGQPGAMDGALPCVGYIALVRGGQDWRTSIILHNLSTTTEASGYLKLFSQAGRPFPPQVSPGSMDFRIPPAGKATLSTLDQGPRTMGYGQVFANSSLEVSAVYSSPRTRAAHAASVVGHSISIPVTVDKEHDQDVQLALLNLEDSGNIVVFSFGGSRGGNPWEGANQVELGPGKHLVGLVSDLLPPLKTGDFKGILTIERRWASFPGGTMAVVAFQSSSGKITPADLKALK